MKKWTLFTLLFSTFALGIALPERGLPAEGPRFEKTNLTRYFASQSYLYAFDFDFVNVLPQPIEIISVNVSDMNGNKVEQDWEASGRNWDVRLVTHALSGNHPLVRIISKPRGTPLEQATVTAVGDGIKITVTNRILSPGQGVRPSLYILSSNNKYDSLILRVAYNVNGNLREVSRTFTVGMREEEEPQLSQCSPEVPGQCGQRYNACVFHKDDVVITQVGHVGWGWKIPGSNPEEWVYGSTDSVPMDKLGLKLPLKPPFNSPVVGAGEKRGNGSWDEQGSFEEMLEKFSRLEYNEIKCRLAINTQVSEQNARRAIEEVETAGYSVVGNNCMNHTVKILEAYGGGNMPNPDIIINWNPTFFFNNLTWEPIKRIPRQFFQG